MGIAQPHLAQRSRADERFEFNRNRLVIHRTDRFELRQFRHRVLHAGLAKIGKLMRIKALRRPCLVCRQEQASSWSAPHHFVRW